MEKRTTSIGLLNYGVAYLQAARLVHEAQKNGEIKLAFSAPAYSMAGHAIELLLKAYFRGKGEGLDELKRRGHNIRELWDAAIEEGLPIPEDAETVGHVGLLSDFVGVPPYESRYIVIGIKRMADLDLILSAAEKLPTTIKPFCSDEV